MEIIQIHESVWVIHAPVNMSLVKTEGGLVAVDTGVDKQAGKTLLKVAKELGFELCAIVNTHAHADHYGGNAQLLRTKEVPVYAPLREATVMMNPRLEPEYLWYGASPLPALQNKFLLAEASPVSEFIFPDTPFEIHGTTFLPVALPGHAHGQVGIQVGNVLFAADAYFDEPVVDKHGIPFMVDFAQTVQSANRILDVSADWYVPGHGKATQSPRTSVEYLVARHVELLQKAKDFLQSPKSVDELVALFCQHCDLAPQNPGAYTLLRTPVAAYVTALVEQGIIEGIVDSGVLKFTPI